MAADTDCYDVVWPLGKKAVGSIVAAPRLDTLESKTIGLLWNYLYRGDRCFAILEELLRERYPGIAFISYVQFGNTHGKRETEVLDALPERLAEFGCDAVLSGMGG